MSGVEQLIFLAGAAEAVAVVEVLDAAVGAGRETEVELEVEVLERFLRHEVAAAAEGGHFLRELLPLAVHDAARRQHGEDAVLDFPALGRGRFATAFFADPAVEGLAVPEQLPAVGLFSFRKGVGGGRGAGERQQGGHHRNRHLHVFSSFLELVKILDASIIPQEKCSVGGVRGQSAICTWIVPCRHGACIGKGKMLH